jgi:hypothetical protein
MSNIKQSLDNLQINFDNFVDKFYSNVSNEKIMLEINIDQTYDQSIDQSFDKLFNMSDFSSTTIYDIHHMLLDLIIQGISILNLDIINNFDKSLVQLQKYFANINIKINICNWTKKDLIEDYSNYDNRYIKFEDPSNMIINGAHQIVKDLKLIKSFFLIDTNNNFSIGFEHMIF